MKLHPTLSAQAPCATPEITFSLSVESLAEMPETRALPGVDLVDEDGYPLDEISSESAKLDWQYPGRSNIVRSLPRVIFEERFEIPI